jgi:hypothetical protein
MLSIRKIKVTWLEQSTERTQSLNRTKICLITVLTKKNRNIFVIISKYSRGQKKVGQCFFANVILSTLSMATIKIFIYLL